MTTSSVAVLIGSGLLVVGLAITGLILIGTLWVVKNAIPPHQLAVKLSGMEAMVQNLEQQVIHLRTKKAGAVSAARKAAKEAQAEEEDPNIPEELRDLDPKDRALFM